MVAKSTPVAMSNKDATNGFLITEGSVAVASATAAAKDANTASFQAGDGPGMRHSRHRETQEILLPVSNEGVLTATAAERTPTPDFLFSV